MTNFNIALRNLWIRKSKQLDFNDFSAWFIEKFVLAYDATFQQEILTQIGYKRKYHIDKLYFWLKQQTTITIH